MDSVFLDTGPVTHEPAPASNPNADTRAPFTSIPSVGVGQPLTSTSEPEWFQETCGAAVGHITTTRPTALEVDHPLTFTEAAVVASSDRLWENGMVRFLCYYSLKMRSLKVL
jgi:hypothetical protein